MANYSKAATSNGAKEDSEAAFSGLWLCPNVLVRGNAVFRSALLFIQSERLNYILRFNHDAVYEGLTMEFFWSYQVEPNVIRQHPLGYPESKQIVIPWQIGDDGSIRLKTHDAWDTFYPSNFEDLFKAGFERDVVAETLVEIRDKGWKYQIEPQLPSFGMSTNATESEL